MKHFAKIAALGLGAIALLAVAACSTSQTDNFIAGLSNFSRGLSAVDQTVKDVNATLYANCSSLVSVASSINDIAGQCSKASTYTSVANSVIDNYCQSAAAQTAGIATSISITASSVAAAKSQLTASKKSCAS